MLDIAEIVMSNKNELGTFWSLRSMFNSNKILNLLLI